MKVAAHQPHFLPWAPYFRKIEAADVFVILGDVQFRKNYYQNRCRIYNPEGVSVWLTVPVNHRFGQKINEVQISDPKWFDNIDGKLNAYYRGCNYFNQIWTEDLREVCAGSEKSLHILNVRTLMDIMSILKMYDTQVLTDAEFTGTSTNPTQRLVDICTDLHATEYLSGPGGRNYLELERFEKAGIKVTYLEGPGEDVSIMDSLFRCGPEATMERIQRKDTV